MLYFNKLIKLSAFILLHNDVKHISTQHCFIFIIIIAAILNFQKVIQP
jgi:hypothetical protein